jgi:hypothetical protein
MLSNQSSSDVVAGRSLRADVPSDLSVFNATSLTVIRMSLDTGLLFFPSACLSMGLRFVMAGLLLGLLHEHRVRVYSFSPFGIDSNVGSLILKATEWQI